MRIKRTKSGKLSMLLTLENRTNLWEGLVREIENPLRKGFHTKEEVMAKLHLYTIAQVLRKRFYIEPPYPVRILFSEPEAIAILWSLRDSKNIQLLDLKSSLHKTLIG